MLSYGIRNMKSFVDSGEIEVKPITVFVGKNSCGKSSLMRFPVVLSQTVLAEDKSPIRFYGKMVDYGNYADVLHHGSTDKMGFKLKYMVDLREMRFMKYNFDAPTKDFAKGSTYFVEDTPNEQEVSLKIILDKDDKNIIVHAAELCCKRAVLFSAKRIEDGKFQINLNFAYEEGKFVERKVQIISDALNFDGFVPHVAKAVLVDICRDATKDCDNDTDPNALFETISDLLGLHVENVPLDELRVSTMERETLRTWFQIKYYNSIFDQLLAKIDAEFRSIRYIGPFRDSPSRFYRDFEYGSSGVGVHGEHISNELLRASSDVMENISKWSKILMGYDIALNEITQGIYQIMLRDENGVQTNLIDNGFGISQVLPIVTESVALMAYQGKESNADKILLIEQPELHLHPAAQAELAELFVDCVKNNDGKKIIIETHSEHLIRKLQILVASPQCPITRDMVRIYYVDKDEKGEAHPEEMRILENGKFENEWPSGFFDKGYLLSRELSKAGIRD
ncbi:MAG: DUF3696 domain-containing protein [Lachnospiraceae bacterium]|nr:DUF3696 domain-containing protein [Lachnospiraceae bacterium]